MIAFVRVRLELQGVLGLDGKAAYILAFLFNFCLGKLFLLMDLHK